jgi:hypothetical protein
MTGVISPRFVSLGWMSNKSETTAKKPGICPGLYLHPKVGLTALG